MWFICVVYLRSRVWLFKFQKKQLVKRKIWSNFAWKCGPFLTAKPVYPYSFGNLRWLLIWESLNVRLFLVVSPVFSFTFLWWKRNLRPVAKKGSFPSFAEGRQQDEESPDVLLDGHFLWAALRYPFMFLRRQSPFSSSHLHLTSKWQLQQLLW